jgi:hypothetical protein
LADGEPVIAKESIGFLRRLLGQSGIPEESRVVELLRERLAGP